MFLRFINSYLYFIYSFSKINALLTSMLRITEIKLWIRDLIQINKDSTIDKIHGVDSKVVGAKFVIIKNHNSDKSKILIKLNKLSSRLRFIILIAKLIFMNLK